MRYRSGPLETRFEFAASVRHARGWRRSVLLSQASFRNRVLSHTDPLASILFEIRVEKPKCTSRNDSLSLSLPC
jgi:hypothetical protein